MKKIRSVLFALALPTFAIAQDVAGPLLALSHAYRLNDDISVGAYLDAARKTWPEDDQLIYQSVLAAVYDQDLDKASKLIGQTDFVDTPPVAFEIVEFAQAIRDEEYEEAAKLSASLSFFDTEVLRAWDAAENDDSAAARDVLSKATLTNPTAKGIYDYHLAQIVAHYDRDYAQAYNTVGNDAPLYFSTNSAYSHMAMLVLSGADDYLTTIEEEFGLRPFWPSQLEQVIAAAEDGNVDPSLTFAHPRNAIAELLEFVLQRSRSAGVDQQTERLLVTLLPQVDKQGDIYFINAMRYFLERDEFEDVLLYARMISKRSAVSFDRQLLEFSALVNLDREEDAAKLLKEYPEASFREKVIKGENYMALDDFDKALQLFRQAAAIEGGTGEHGASVHFALGRAAERLGLWEEAEASFRKSIAFDGERASVLNYLGYSLVDRGEKLAEGLELIEGAVELEPNSGPIIDSLGWAHFRLGNYDDALVHMERAAELMSQDPVVNSHLGDVFYRLGRKREAGYQWERARGLMTEDSPDLKMADLEDRLLNGLPE